MASLNKCAFIGNCGKDPEIRTFDNGDKIASVSIAVTQSYKNKAGEKVETTEWINLEFSGNYVGVVEKYIKKGSPIYVEGRYKTETWEKDNVKHSRVKIRVSEMVMLGGRTDSAQPDIPANTDSDGGDDLPF
jgi:single-strand DNA-binding protein